MRDDGGNLPDGARALKLIEALGHLAGMALGRLLSGMDALKLLRSSSHKLFENRAVGEKPQERNNGNKNEGPVLVPDARKRR